MYTSHKTPSDICGHDFGTNTWRRAAHQTSPEEPPCVYNHWSFLTQCSMIQCSPATHAALASKESTGRHWLMSDFFFFFWIQDVNKVNHWKLKGTSTFFDTSVGAEGLRWVIISRQIGWLTTEPFIQQMRRLLMTHCLECACASWYEMRNRWRWRYNSDDNSVFFVLASTRPNDEFTFEFTSANPFLPELRFPVSTVT